MKNCVGGSLPIALGFEIKLRVIVLLPALQGRKGKVSFPTLMPAAQMVPSGPKAGE
jgi:hypothetical protein